MNAVILSGGFGTRLRPLTLTQPKAVLPVLNKPFCLYPLEWLARHGTQKIVFATGYRSKSLATVLKKEKPRNVTIRCKVEHKPLGTGGALRQAAGRSRERCVALNGDILTNFNLKQMLDFHLRRKAILTLALIKVPDISRFGSVSLDSKGRIKRFIEKRPGRIAGWVNAGIYIFEPEALRQIPPITPCSLERDVFPRLTRERQGIYGYPIRGYWNDVGTFPSYLQAHRDLLKSRTKPVLIGKGTRVGKEVQLNGMVCIGRNCRIEDGAILEDSIILDHVRIGKKARIAGSILSTRCRIGSHAELRAGTVLGENTVVPEFNRC